MTTVSVNWELAPKGTTHFLTENADYYDTWIMKFGREWFVWYGDQWNESYDIHRYDDEFIVKPKEESEQQEKQIVWDGNGLPPVGTVCEAAIPHTRGPDNERSFIWIKGRVIAYHEIKGKTYAWFAEEDGFYPPNVLEFRPIRTPEQIAEEERKAAQKAAEKDIAELLESWGLNPIDSRQAARAIHSAGYRKEQK